MIKRNMKAEIARLKAAMKKSFGDFCPHKTDGLFLVFETDGTLRTSNLKPCEHCSRARRVHSISFLAGLEAEQTLLIPDAWLSTFDKANSGGVKIYGSVDPDLI